MSTNPYGLIDRAEYNRMCASIRRSPVSSYSKTQQLAAARLLLDDAARVGAAAPPDDGDGLDEEFRHMWPPLTPREARARHEAVQLAAAARRDANDGELTDEEWLALFGEPPPEDQP
jgi:hypothetical protein